MNKTSIEWCDYTWNPVTGCLHECPYCYARKRVMRMPGFWNGEINIISDTTDLDGYPVVCGEFMYRTKKEKFIRAPWPFGFIPTFHEHHLDEPQKLKESGNIFVCSMADLFGEWVPDEWIEDVFKACEEAPQHRYLFLTKNPARYSKIFRSAFDYVRFHKNTYFGATATDTDSFNEMGEQLLIHKINTSAKIFLSIEPLRTEISKRYLNNINNLDWVIIGAETGNRKNKVIPRREWIESIVNQCHAANVPVFMKNSLSPIWGEKLIQEYPW